MQPGPVPQAACFLRRGLAEEGGRQRQRHREIMTPGGRQQSQVLFRGEATESRTDPAQITQGVWD